MTIKKVKEFKLLDRITSSRSYQIVSFPTRKKAVLQCGFEGCGEPWADKTELKITIKNLRESILAGRASHYPIPEIKEKRKQVYLRLKIENIKEGQKLIDGERYFSFNAFVEAALEYWIEREHTRKKRKVIRIHPKKRR